MERLAIKATIAATGDQGVFEAILTSGRPDREKDITLPTAMLSALKAWGGRMLPLIWNHGRTAADVIGAVDTTSGRLTDTGEVAVTGEVDLSAPSGEEAWRSLKRGVLGLSFAYIPTKSSPRRGGGRVLEALDVLEVTLTPTPVDSQTRVLSYKGKRDDDMFGLGKRRNRMQVDAWMSAYADSDAMFLELLRWTKSVGGNPYLDTEPRASLSALSEDERHELWTGLRTGIEERQRAAEIERMDQLGLFYRAKTHEPRWIIQPGSGAIVDAAEREILDRQEQERERTRQAEAEARRSEVADRAASRDSAEAAAVQEIRAKTPPGVWHP